MIHKNLFKELVVKTGANLAIIFYLNKFRIFVITFVLVNEVA